METERAATAMDVWGWMGAQIRPLQPPASPESILTSTSTFRSPGAHASHPFLASASIDSQAHIDESPLRAVHARIAVPHEFVHSPSTKFVLGSKAREVRSAPSGSLKSAEKESRSHGRRLPKRTKTILYCPITLPQLLGLHHRRSQRYQLGS